LTEDPGSSAVLRLQSGGPVRVTIWDVAREAQVSKAGHGVPADISLVGFDDIRFAELSRIALTTVHQPRALMGRQVTELVLDRLDRPDPHDRRAIVIEPQLTIRGSTGLLMTTNPGSS
jgi:DNA-binding LacI/PurR family transcriptional regulator